jgi:pantetheine-phosphate adenylyltransferase
MKTVLYPGSFDPLTNGHMDLIERASKLFDQVIVGVALNSLKNPLFTVDERVCMLKESCVGLNKVTVVSFSGLLVDALDDFQAQAVLRGLRAFSDFEFELQMALMNRSLKEGCETIFMMPSQENSFVSSTMVKEVASFGGEFEKFVPPAVAECMARKLAKDKK